MQAYQSAPCPFCGITWNPPGAQGCANCRNALPPAGPAYAPPGYAPPGYAPGSQNQPYPGFPPAGYPPNGPLAQLPQYPQNGPYAQPPYGPYGQPAAAGYPVATPGQQPAGTVLPVLGRTVAVPFVIPPLVLRHPRAVLCLAAGVLALAVVVLGVTPAVAAGQLTASQRALQVCVSHQPVVDAAFARFFTALPGLNDPNAEKVALQQQTKVVTDGLASVQADEAALRSADQRLSVLQVVAPTRGAAVSAQRQRLRVALTGLQQADVALTAAVNETTVAAPYLDALIDYTKMGAALGKRDLVGAGAPYPDAQQKVEAAMALDHAAGLPPAIALQVSSFSDALNATEALIQALQAKDPAAIKKANDAIQAAVKAMSSPAETVPADYESKTFGPMQKAYDSAIKTLKR